MFVDIAAAIIRHSKLDVILEYIWICRQFIGLSVFGEYYVRSLRVTT